MLQFSEAMINSVRVDIFVSYIIRGLYIIIMKVEGPFEACKCVIDETIYASERDAIYIYIFYFFQ